MSKQIVPIKAKFTKIDGKNIHYLEAGNGSPLLFLHAFCSTSKTFIGLMQYLARNYKVYTPDLPGFGLSDEMDEKLNLINIKNFIYKFAEHLNLKDFTLSGASLGGILSAYFAKEHDDLVSQYLLLEPYYGIETLLFPRSTILFLKLSTFFFTKLIPRSLGEKFWNNKKLLLKIEKTLDPLQNDIDRNRPDSQKLEVFKSATFTTFWQVLDCILKLDLENEESLTEKKTVFIMPRVDDSLDFSKTYEGYKRMFPNIKSFKIDLTGHYPIEPLTLEFIERKFPNLLNDITKYLNDK